MVIRQDIREDTWDVYVLTALGLGRWTCHFMLTYDMVIS